MAALPPNPSNDCACLSAACWFMNGPRMALTPGQLLLRTLISAIRLVHNSHAHPWPNLQIPTPALACLVLPITQLRPELTPTLATAFTSQDYTDLPLPTPTSNNRPLTHLPTYLLSVPVIVESIRYMSDIISPLQTTIHTLPHISPTSRTLCHTCLHIVRRILPDLMT